MHADRRRRLLEDLAVVLRLQVGDLAEVQLPQQTGDARNGNIKKERTAKRKVDFEREEVELQRIMREMKDNFISGAELEREMTD